MPYREGDRKSWWASLSDGSRVWVRMQEFVEHSPTTARLLSSDNWNRLRQTLAGHDTLAHKPVDMWVLRSDVKPMTRLASAFLMVLREYVDMLAVSAADVPK